MAGSTLYYLDPASPFSKDVWLQGAYEQLEDTPGLLFNMLDQIEPDRAEGRNTFFKLDIGDSLGQGMVKAQGGDFPPGEDSEWAEAKLVLARLAHTAELTMDEWELLRSEAAAAVDVVAHKISKATSKMTRELARQTHMDGSSKLARTGVTTASTTVVLQGTATNQIDRDRLNWLAPRRVLVDIVNGTTGALIGLGRRRVMSIAADGLSMVISGAAVTTTANDFVTWAGSVADFSAGTYVSGEVVGLGQLMKTGRTWLGLNSATVGNDYWDPVWRRGSTPGTPEAFTLGRFQKLLIEIAKRAQDGAQPGANSGHVLFSGHGVAAHAMAQFSSQIRYVDPTPGESMEFGFTEIQGLGIRWLQDVHYAHNVLDCLRIQGELGLSFVRPANPMQGLLDFVTAGSGDMWHLANAASATSQGHAAKMLAYLTGLFGLCCKKPSENGRLDDILEPV